MKADTLVALRCVWKLNRFIIVLFIQIYLQVVGMDEVIRHVQQRISAPKMAMPGSHDFGITCQDIEFF